MRYSNLFKSCVLLSIIAMIGTSQIQAKGLFKKKNSIKSDSTSKKSEYEKFFAKDCLTADGFIKMHKMKDKLYFELPLNIIEKEMMLGSTVSEISDNANAIIGSKPSDPIHFRFSKIDNTICMKLVKSDNITTSLNQGIQRALNKSNIDPTINSFKILHYSPDSSAVVFDVSELFIGDEKSISPFDPYSANMGGSYKRSETFKRDLSFIGDIKGFSDNIVVKSTLSYTYSLSSGRSSVAKDTPFTALMTRSIILLPQVAYRPRITDSRIAIFPTDKMLYDGASQQIKSIYYANRWRLEASDTTAYKRGEQVDPIKPITFYIDSDFPEWWKKYIKEGVEQWSEVFAEIGFSNTIIAKDYPQDDAQFDPDNIKYSCIRYAPIGVANAMGPSWVDPRSGEIINASVYLYHDAIKLINNWLFVQTSPADQRVRTTQMPEYIIGDALRYVVAHEIGHCLGFMHNMSASANIPVDSLRSASFTQKYGTTTSIMDYARFNYVAQPGDYARGVKMTPPRFGEYDKFLIKWNYTPLFDTKSSQDEYAITSQWLKAASANDVLRYGKQQYEIIDPRSQTEDLGDNSMKASAYGIKNLKYIIVNLNKWLDDQDSDYSYRTNIYNEIIMQYFNYIGHVYANVGGIYLYEKHRGDSIQSYISVPREIQKEAVKFIMDELSSLDWIDNKDLMNNITIMGSPADVLRNIMMKMLIESPEKVSLSADKSASNPYGVKECLDDIFDYVWSSTLKAKKLTPTQMKLQKLFLSHVGNGAGVKIGASRSKSIVSSDYQALIHSSADRHKHSVVNPVAGYSDPMLSYSVPKQFDGTYFGYILKSRDFIAKMVKHPDPHTRSHYLLLQQNIDKALKN